MHKPKSDFTPSSKPDRFKNNRRSDKPAHTDAQTKPAREPRPAGGGFDQPAEREDIVVGRGAIQELLRSGRPIECLFLQQGLSGGSFGSIVSTAKERGIVIKQVDPGKLEFLCAGANHQGVIAQVASASYSTVDDLFARAEEKGEQPFFVIADQIEDPHNLGAIIRTAEAAGAHGLIIPKRRSAGLTYTVGKTSAGAVEHLPVARVTNLAATITQLKARNVWIYGADMDGENWSGIDYRGAVALVVGSEGSGISRLVREQCDFVVSLPMLGKISSLNVSVATGIICYEIARQRTGLPGFTVK